MNYTTTALIIATLMIFNTLFYLTPVLKYVSKWQTAPLMKNNFKMFYTRFAGAALACLIPMIVMFYLDWKVALVYYVFALGIEFSPPREKQKAEIAASMFEEFTT